MYKATQNLSNENVEHNVKVQFVIYHIDRSMAIPYLQLYLVKDCNPISEVEESNIYESAAKIKEYVSESEYLTFPSIDYDAKSHFLFTLYCQGVVESLFHDEREYVSSIQHRGHLLDLELQTAYAFFELIPTTTEAEFITHNTFIWPVLMDEILHKNRVLNVPIHSLVTTFFVTNPSFIYLQDAVEVRVDNDVTSSESTREYLVYDMPVVVYCPVPGKLQNTQFTAMFGVLKTDGVFKFYSYDRAVSMLREEQRTGTHGLVRLALYAGSTTIDKDEFEGSAEYKTFYFGYEYHAKDYHQQKPLSYHRIPLHRHAEELPLHIENL